jgi:Protein of unknown function (DUF1579)
MSQKFEASLAEGNHSLLKSFEGTYEGTTTVWFEPGSKGEEAACSGSLRSILGGRFLLHEYKSSLQGKPIEGLAIFGYSIGDEKLQCAWVDSFHNGTAIMLSENSDPSTPFSFLGYYGKDPKWGWRTAIERPSKNQIKITMYNIEPGGSDEKAVETIYERIN